MNLWDFSGVTSSRRGSRYYPHNGEPECRGWWSSPIASRCRSEARRRADLPWRSRERSRARRASGSAGAAKSATPGPARTVEHEGISYVTVDLGKADHQEFYNGFANGVLWPILHYRLDLVEFTRRDLGGYMPGQRLFRAPSRSVPQARRYHLGARLSFDPAGEVAARARPQEQDRFLPPYSVSAAGNPDGAAEPRPADPALCAITIWSASRPMSMRQTSRAMWRRSAGCAWASGNSFHFHERTVEFGAFPIGVETAAFAKLARRAMRSDVRAGRGREPSGRAMIIGVDRLDYSKGLPLRHRCVREFAGEFPAMARQMHAICKSRRRSRTDIPEYDRDRPQVGEAAGAHQRRLWRGGVDADPLCQQGA